jgi:hypothetical protein
VKEKEVHNFTQVKERTGKEIGILETRRNKAISYRIAFQEKANHSAVY